MLPNKLRLNWFIGQKRLNCTSIPELAPDCSLSYNFYMPIYDSNTLEFFSRSPEQTRRLGIRIGTLLKTGDVICLSGELGSGKTTLVQGIAQGWGSLDGVTSPTFIIVNVYRKPDGKSLYHLDAFRLQNAFEAEELDIVQMIEEGILVIEWPEQIEDAIPHERLTIKMEWLADEQRGMLFQPQGDRYNKIMAEFRQSAFRG
jgi:tRNA threonylcarbamoyladenosine biosynthesis protein TsaE